MSAPERTLITKFVADRDYLRIDETVPTFIAAGQEALDAIKAKFSPSSERPCRAYDQDAGEFKVCLGEEWLDENNIIIVNGTAYQRSGTLSGSWPVNATPASSGIYYKYYRVTLPVPAAPSGWRYYVTQIESTAIIWTCHANSGSNWVDFHVFGVGANAQMTKLRWELVPN